jgi:hypothetical protein
MIGWTWNRLSSKAINQLDLYKLALAMAEPVSDKSYHIYLRISIDIDNTHKGFTESMRWTSSYWTGDCKT